MSNLDKAWEAKAKQLLHTEEYLMKRLDLLTKKINAAREIGWVWRTFRKKSDAEQAGYQATMIDTSDQEMQALEFFDYVWRKTGGGGIAQIY